MVSCYSNYIGSALAAGSFCSGKNTQTRSACIPMTSSCVTLKCTTRLASFPGLQAQLLSLAVRKVGGRPGRIYHVMCATDTHVDDTIFGTALN